MAFLPIVITFVFTLFITCCDAVAFPGPAVTPCVPVAAHPAPHQRIPDISFPPEPLITPAPRLRLQIRQLSGQLPPIFTGWAAPDYVCGYPENPDAIAEEAFKSAGRTTYAMRCETWGQCAVSSKPNNPVLLCCAGKACRSVTTCINEAQSRTLCDPVAGCPDGTQACSGSWPVCGTEALDGPWGRATQWGCFQSSLASIILYTTSYLGEADAKPWAQYNLLSTKSDDTTNIESNSQSSDTPIASDTGSGTTNDIARGTTAGASDSTSTSSNFTPVPQTTKTTAIGPIVGGVVGGVAILAIMICVLYLIYRRTRGNKNGGDLPDAPVPQPPKMASPAPAYPYPPQPPLTTSPASAYPPPPAPFGGAPQYGNAPQFGGAVQNEPPKAELEYREVRRSELP